MAIYPYSKSSKAKKSCSTGKKTSKTKGGKKKC